MMRHISEVFSEDRSNETITVLALEFEYAKESSFKAQSDRLTLVNFYIGIFIATAAAAFGGPRER